MTEPSLQLGGGNWAGKSGNLLAYHKVDGNFYANDLTFTRASTGTIVNSDGLIEEVPYNKLQQSNDFDTTWSVGNSTINGGQADKDGGNSAWVIASTTIGSETRIRQSLSFVIGDTITLSCYMKAGTVNFGIVRTYSIAGGGRVWFNLLSGTVGTENSGLTGSIESVGGGWYRCSITGVVTNTGAVDIAPAPADNDYLANAVGETVYIQDAQLNSGSTAKPYFPTTTRLNMPRVTYKDNSNGSLLLEPQRTNSITYSEDFSQTVYTKLNLSITANSSTSPDGTQNSTLVVPNSTIGNRLIVNNTVANLKTNSVFLKKKELEYVKLGNASATVVVNLSNGTLSKSSDSTNDYSIESYGNEWYRVSIYNKTATNYQIQFFFGVDSSGANIATNGTDGLYIFGFEIQDGSYPTSYIPTSGSTVTRVADACSQTGLSDVIGQTEGTMFVEINNAVNTGTSDRVVAIGDGTSANRIIIIKNASGNIFFFVASGGSIIINEPNISGTSIVNGNCKIAVAYKSGDYAIYLNGVSVFTSTVTVVPSTSNYYLAVNEEGGVSYFNGSVNQAQLYKTRLSNAELATLTTL